MSLTYGATKRRRLRSGLGLVPGGAHHDIGFGLKFEV